LMHVTIPYIMSNIDGTDLRSLTHSGIEARKCIAQQIAFYVPGCEKAYVSNTGAQFGIRDTRRVVGECTFTVDECLRFQKHPESVILSGGGPIDNTARGFRHPERSYPCRTSWTDAIFLTAVSYLKDVDVKALQRLLIGQGCDLGIPRP
jgi:hypothetical protein